MITMALITLLIRLMGDTSLPFLLPKEEKSISKVIVEKDRRKQLEIIVKGIGNKEKAFKKEKKFLLKEIEKLNIDRDATVDQFNKIADKIRATNEDAFNYMVTSRLELGNIVTTDEWVLILADSKKRYQRTEKKYNKVYPAFEKSIEKLIKRIESSIDSEERTAIVITHIQDFSALTVKNSKELTAINVYEHPVLSNIMSTEQELLTVGQEIRKLRNQITEGYIALHVLIAVNTTEQEWPKVVKKVNRLF
jgi:hypothetical protein